MNEIDSIHHAHDTVRIIEKGADISYLQVLDIMEILSDMNPTDIAHLLLLAKHKEGVLVYPKKMLNQIQLRGSIYGY